MSTADEARICRMSDLAAAEARVVASLTKLEERLSLLEGAMVEMAEPEANPEPDDALARLHQQFRAKCRKAEGHTE